MQIRCTYCRTPFSVSRDEMLYALEKIDAEGLKFYNFHCPSCRRANRVESRKLQRALPNWKDILAERSQEAQD